MFKFQIRKYQGRLTQPELDALQRKTQLINTEVENVRAQIKKGGINGLRGINISSYIHKSLAILCVFDCTVNI